MNDFSENTLLGGRVKIKQPKNGFRAAIDSVLLAAAVPAKKGQTVLEAGSGSGAASLCLAARVKDISITGLEIQKEIT
ncbi:MAG: methyltransferase, partial [Alphaproteobacteria bacterium]|nr:methyltransferase [Alphaproteobacteria bacterium]